LSIRNPAIKENICGYRLRSNIRGFSLNQINNTHKCYYFLLSYTVLVALLTASVLAFLVWAAGVLVQ
jgi:hypothetical protein